MWNLQAGNGEIILTSESYKGEEQRAERHRVG
jgi:uncharacterized protein YegP (UPF0339 family)